MATSGNQGSIAALDRQTGCAAVVTVMKRLHFYWQVNRPCTDFNVVKRHLYCHGLAVGLDFRSRRTQAHKRPMLNGWRLPAADRHKPRQHCRAG